MTSCEKAACPSPTTCIIIKIASRVSTGGMDRCQAVLEIFSMKISEEIRENQRNQATKTVNEIKDRIVEGKFVAGNGGYRFNWRNVGEATFESRRFFGGNAIQKRLVTLRHLYRE